MAKNDERTVTKEQALTILRSRTYTQLLTLNVALFIKENKQKLSEKRIINYNLNPILLSLNEIMYKLGYHQLMQEEVQMAINSVFAASRCEIIDWGKEEPYITMTFEDAKKVLSYVHTLQPLAAEKKVLGLSDAVDEDLFDSIL